MGKCSADTALSDINDLLARGVLRKTQDGDVVRGMCWATCQHIYQGWRRFSDKVRL